MQFHLRFLIVFAISGLAIPLRAQETPDQIVGFAFDWDDNIFEMPTEIVLFHRETGKEKTVTTDEFAQIRSLIGKAGTIWADYELQNARKDGSFRNFRDDSIKGAGVFLDDIKNAMTAKNYPWQGPTWNAFVKAMQLPGTAARTWIISARAHEPQTLSKALQFLQKQKHIRNTVPMENIWTVGSPNFDKYFADSFNKPAPGGNSSEPSARKAAVMSEILDRIQAIPLKTDALEVLAPEGGQSRKPMHLWGFSDDDFDNFKKAAEVLQKGVDTNRWNNIKITLYFTGTNHKEKSPKSIVLRNRAAPRDLTEINEWQEVLANLKSEIQKEKRIYRVYLAGPEVFRPDALLHGQKKVDSLALFSQKYCEPYGIQLIGQYPLDNTIEDYGHNIETGTKIFENNTNLMDRCDMVIANMTPFRGVSMDVGTGYEMGYMHAQKKYVVGYSDPGSMISTEISSKNESLPLYAARVMSVYKTTQGAHEIVDSDGFSVEQFGFTDNLMLSGTAHHGNKAVAPTFEKAVDELCTYLRRN